MSFVERDGYRFYFRKGTRQTGIVLFHEIYGLDSYVTSVADKLSENGFAVVAPDLYGGRKASSLEEGFKLRKQITNDYLLNITRKAISIIKYSTKIKSIGTMGFCMGGGLALQASSDLSLDFCVDFYGMMEDADKIMGLNGPVLLILASQDERVNPWVFQKLLLSASKYQKRVELHIYPNTVHAFHRPGWEGHNKEAAEDAWKRALSFLKLFE